MRINRATNICIILLLLFSMAASAANAQPAGTGLVKGFVFVDSNKNGKYEAGEPGIANVKVSLIDAQGRTVVRGLASKTGFYRFGNLNPGIYTVVEEKPAGYTNSSPTRVIVNIKSGGILGICFGNIPGTMVTPTPIISPTPTTIPANSKYLVFVTSYIQGRPLFNGQHQDLRGYISVIDGSNGATVGKISDGVNPWFTAISPDHTRLYVSHMDMDGNISVIDTKTGNRLATIKVQHSAGMTVSPDGGRLYVVKTGINPSRYNNISVVDTKTFQEIGRINVGSDPMNMALNPAGTKAYVANLGSGTVSVIDTARSMVIKTINVGPGPREIVINSDGSKAYLIGSVNSSSYDNMITIISTATDSVIGNIVLGSKANHIAISPDGKRLFLTGYETNKLLVVDTTFRKVIKEISVGFLPSSVAVAPDNSRIYVGSGDGKVTVVDGNTYAVMGSVTVGNYPNAIVIG